MTRTNELGQPIGPALADWKPPTQPLADALAGQYCRLEPLSSALHASQLFDAYSADATGGLWTYLPFGPFVNEEALGDALDGLAKLQDWRAYAVSVDEAAVGICCYLRIAPEAGSVEIGSIVFSPALQQTTAATEALYLLIQHCFDRGYRRCEWKCDDLNAPSRAAAARLGFSYEGTFGKATHYKGRSRDTAWFAILDDAWPALHAEFEAWLAPANFDGEGRQRSLLGDRRR